LGEKEGENLTGKTEGILEAENVTLFGEGLEVTPHPALRATLSQGRGVKKKRHPHPTLSRERGEEEATPSSHPLKGEG